MIGKPLLAGSAALFLASVMAPSVAAENGELDVTMKVVDDARDVQRVVDSIGRDRSAPSEREPAAAASPRTARTEEPRPAAQPAPNRDVLEMKADVDRDEESEGELEDYDLEEDLEVPDEE
jgi:hypothetical protein